MPGRCWAGVARWGPAEFAAQVLNGANALAASGIKAGSIVILARSGGATFFADLLAVWASAPLRPVSTRPTLTQSEIETFG